VTTGQIVLKIYDRLEPAIGERAAGTVLGRTVGETFSLSRFAEGWELRSTYGGNRA
jgi:hypothetical protein